MQTKAHENWGIFKNPFLNNTSYKSFYIATADHESKLKNAKDEELIFPFWERYSPLHEKFVNAYTKWEDAKSELKGATMRVDKKQDELNRAIGMWDVKIQTVFFHDTPEYQTILPYKRNPFQKGGRETRLAALNRLKEALNRYPSLTTVAIEVNTFYQSFLALRDQQQQLNRQLHDASEELRQTREKAADMMYRNLLGLLSVLGVDYKVAGFFDIGLVRKQYNKPIEETDEEDLVLDIQEPIDEGDIIVSE